MSGRRRRGREVATSSAPWLLLAPMKRSPRMTNLWRISAGMHLGRPPRLLDQLEDLTLGGRALVVEGDHRIVVVPALHVPGVDQRLSVDAKDGIRHDVDRATG